LLRDLPLATMRRSLHGAVIVAVRGRH